MTHIDQQSVRVKKKSYGSPIRMSHTNHRSVFKENMKDILTLSPNVGCPKQLSIKNREMDGKNTIITLYWS